MKKTTRNYIWILVANALLVLAVGLFWQFRLEAPQFGAAEEALPDAPYMRDFTQTAHLSDLKGQWTLLNLWASWCAPCVAEMPALQALADDYRGEGLRVVAISLDDTRQAAESAIEKHGFGPIARNLDKDGAVFAALNPAGVPVTYLLDPAGGVRLRLEGEQDWASPDVRAGLESMISGSKDAR